MWHAKLVLATTGLHLAQFRHKHRPRAKAVDYADIFIYDEAQQEAALSDLAILGALPRKCLVLRLGDSKQTSGGTESSDLARQVRYMSDRLTNLPLASVPRASHTSRKRFRCCCSPCCSMTFGFMHNEWGTSSKVPCVSGMDPLALIEERPRLRCFLGPTYEHRGRQFLLCGLAARS